MNANVAQRIEKSKLTLIKGDAMLKRANLDKFRKGFHSFVRESSGENFITYMLRSPKMAAEAAKDARKRIADMNLPLTVEHGESFDTFIVKA